MRKARSEEDWENRGPISIFGTPKTTISASVFCSKKHKNRYQMFERSLECFPNRISSPHFAPYTNCPVLCIISKPYSSVTQILKGSQVAQTHLPAYKSLQILHHFPTSDALNAFVYCSFLMPRMSNLCIIFLLQRPLLGLGNGGWLEPGHRRR